MDPPKDGVIATYEEHEDSVYASCWSTADPWVFASLSYDGRLVINKVPRAEKYKILLQVDLKIKLVFCLTFLHGVTIYDTF